MMMPSTEMAMMSSEPTRSSRSGHRSTSEAPGARHRVTVKAWRRNRSTAAIRGPVDAVYPALRDAGVSWSWDRFLRAYVVPLRLLDRVFAALEDAGHRVDYQAGLW